MSQFVRTYSIEDRCLICNVVFVPSDEDMSLPYSLSLHAVIDPDYDTIDPAILLQTSSEAPLDVRISEMEHFLKVLKTMFYA